MEAEARYTWVGASVLLLIAGLVAGILWLKNIGGQDEYHRYAILFDRQALDGLEIGADVSLRGIKVGRVEDYALYGDKDNPNRVRVEVRVDRRAPVRTNTEAVVTRNFVTGIAAITLVNGEPAGAPLTAVPPGEQYPVIGEGRSDLAEITGRVNQVGEIASRALSNLNDVLNDDNRAALAATIRNLRDLSAGVGERLSALDRTLAGVGAAAGDVGRAATHLGGAGERIAAVAERGGERVDRTLAETERTLAEARRAMQDLSRTADAVQQLAASTAKQVEGAAVRADDQLSAALAEMRLSLESAARVIDALREPRAALLGPSPAQLGPGEALP